MSIKADAQQHVAEFFKENSDKDNAITASQLADLVQRDAKTVRASLRKLQKRDQSTLKGARWRITKTIAQDELERVMRADAKKVENAS